VRRAELELATLSSLDLKAFFVDGSVVPATQQDQIRQRGVPTLGPILNMMGLAEGKITAWEAAPVVAIGDRSAHGCRNRTRPGPNLHDQAIGIMTHLHPTGIARQPLGRFRGNAGAALDH
jgi:hypothetical protein